MLLRVVLDLVAPLLGEHVDDVDGVEGGPLQDEAPVVRVQLAGQVDVLVVLVDGLHVALVQAYDTSKREKSDAMRESTEVSFILRKHS